MPFPAVLVALALSTLTDQRLAQAQQQPADVTIPSGTPVLLRLDQFASSETSHAGDELTFTVARSVLVNRVVVIREDTAAIGKVTIASPRKVSFGVVKVDVRGGAVAIVPTATLAVDGTLIHLKLADTSRNASAGHQIKWQIEGKILDCVVDGDYAIKPR